MGRKSDLSRLGEIHQALNASTQNRRDAYAECRRRIMAMIASTEQDGRLVMLGAGNCNDVELDVLVSRFEEVHLFDVDSAAMAGAIERANLGSAVRTRRCDLSGVYSKLRRWRRHPPKEESLHSLVAQAAETFGPKPGAFDCVVSSLVLSQLVHTAMVELGRSHRSLRVVAKTSVLCHLELAAALVGDQGSMVFAVDTFARPQEELARSLERLSADELLLHAEARGMCLPGTEVSFLVGALRARFPSASIELLPPWLWSPGQRSHLVYGLIVRMGQTPQAPATKPDSNGDQG